MIYIFETWLEKVLPYPTLSREFGNIILINDIIKTKVPGIALGCVPVDAKRVQLSEYLCYYANDGIMYFDDDDTIIKLYRHSIIDVDEHTKLVLTNRFKNKYTT